MIEKNKKINKNRVKSSRARIDKESAALSRCARSEDSGDREFLLGRNPVIEALKSDVEIERILIAKGGTGSVEKIKQMAKDAGIRVDFAERTVLDRMAGGEKHQGVVAEISEYKYSELDDIFERAESSSEDPFIVILDGIEDPHNLGAIIRTAECAGAHGVIIPKRNACGLNSTVAKTSAGAIANMPVVRVTNLVRLINELQDRNIWVTACDMDGLPYYELDLTGPVAIVIGSEGKGIGQLVKEHCDFVATIPMLGKTNSLNASNAAAIIMYEVRRRRIE